MKKKYTTNTKGLMLVFGIIGLFWVVLAITSPTPVKAVLYIIIFFSLIILTLTKGCYLILSGNSLTNVQGFLPRKMEIDKITHVSQRQIYRGASGLKSLYFFYKDRNDNSRYSHISLGLYRFDTLVSLIQDLRELNSKIEVDDAIKRMMEKKVGPKKSNLFGTTYLGKRDVKVLWIGMGGIALSVILFFLLGFGFREYFSYGFLPLIFPLILGIGIFFAGYLVGGGRIKSGLIGMFGFWALLFLMYLVSLLKK